MKWIVVLLNILCVSAWSGAAPSTTKGLSVDKLWHSKEVAKLVNELLQRTEQKNFSMTKTGKLVESDLKKWTDAQDAIITDRTPVGDCALVRAIVPLQGDNDIECWIESRGKRMLPILAYAVGHPEIRNAIEAERLNHIRVCQEFISTHKKMPHCDY
jgi:hypothetical protein